MLKKTSIGKCYLRLTIVVYGVLNIIFKIKKYVHLIKCNYLTYYYTLVILVCINIVYIIYINQ